MIQDIKNNNENIGANDEQMAILKAHFPSCFSADGSFDIQRFSSEISDKTQVLSEGYELRFLGKSYAKLLASTASTTVLIPDELHNSKAQNCHSDNLYISGDNLDALKHLNKSYQRKIKCIYIDPPYNTGSDGFTYRDNFDFSLDALQERLSISLEEAERLKQLTTRGSASHSAWLMFMYSRLLLSRSLMSNDGVIFISIDDNEQANLRLLCDYVFGEENWVGTIIWKNATDNNPTQIAVEHEYVLVYARTKSLLEREWKSKISDIKELLVKKGEELNASYPDELELKEAYTKWFRAHKSELWPLDRYKYIDRDGIYTGSQSVHNPGKEGYRYDVPHDKSGKACKQPLMGYRFPWSTMQSLLEGGKILFGEDENKLIELKLYAKEYSAKLASVIEYDGRIGSYDLKEIFPNSKRLFTNPKPVKFISQLIAFVAKDKHDIVLDFFSGSASTANAVMQLNSEDGVQRNFIAVQLPEPLSAGTASQKEAYEFLLSRNLPTTLDYVGFERIKLAAEKLSTESKYPDLDWGFKHLSLAEPNQNTLDKLKSFDKNVLLADTSVLDDFGNATILATWLNADGYGLSANARLLDLAGYPAYYFKDHLYLIQPSFSLQSMKKLIETYESSGDFNPKNLVLFGYSFPNWSINEMLEKNLKVLNDRERNLSVNLAVRY